MWRGAISFGMVAIPVRMYLATDSKSVSFRMLCPSCQRPIKNKRWCPHENIEVGWSDTLRGYETGKDEFVVIDDQDLDRVPLPTNQAIEILEFVEDSQIDAGVYLRQSYYLEPEKVGAKPYELLRQALERTGRVAVGRLALRDREHLVRLALHEDGIVLNTLHWPDEIRSMSELDIPRDVSIAKPELDMAVMLVENLSAAEFDPSKYHDRYREALMEVVEEKLGDRPMSTPAAVEPPQVMDLMAALKASLEASKGSEGAGEPAEEEEATPARRSRSRRAEGAAEPAARRRKAS